MIASTIGQIVHPLFELFAWLLAAFYSVIPNYAIAIALLTLTVMVVVFPITRRGTRSMMRMQLLSPDIKELQRRHKAQPGATTLERQEARTKLNEEMMGLYRERGVSPTGGCLPMFMQFPIFWILYDTIRGLTHTVPKTTTVHGHAVTKLVSTPLYISHSSRLYKDLHAAGGAMKAFGINLADSVRTGGVSWPNKIPFIIMILITMGLSYYQMRSMTARNPAAAAMNPQMQSMQKVMPIIFGFIYIAIPAGVNVYFIVSSLFRIGQQEFMYRHDPMIRASVAELSSRVKAMPKGGKADTANGSGPTARPKGLLARLTQGVPAPAALPPAKPTSERARDPRSGNGTTRPPSDQQAQAKEQGQAKEQAKPPQKPSAPQNGRTPASAASSPIKRNHPRAQNKRARRPR